MTWDEVWPRTGPRPRHNLNWSTFQRMGPERLFSRRERETKAASSLRDLAAWRESICAAQCSGEINISASARPYAKPALHPHTSKSC